MTTKKFYSEELVSFLIFVFIVSGYLLGYFMGCRYTSNLLTEDIDNLKLPSHIATATPESQKEAVERLRDIDYAINEKRKVFVSSWYDYTLDGIEWSKNHRTCASRDYPRKTMLRVKNLANNKTVDCLVNDYITHPKRDIDLSSYAFAKIADLKLGLIQVSITKLE